MQNIIALLLSLLAFTASVVTVNAQASPPDAPFGFDIRLAVEWLADQIAYFIESNVQDPTFRIPYFGALALGSLGLSLPAIFVFVLFGRTGR